MKKVILRLSEKKTCVLSTFDLFLEEREGLREQVSVILKGFKNCLRDCKVNCVKVRQTLTLTPYETRRTIQFRGDQEKSPGAVPLGQIVVR
jgi:hypothetical protein